MNDKVTFRNHAIVACGTLTMELTHLVKHGTLDPEIILYTMPGRHEAPRELEDQLIRQIGVAKKYVPNIIVVYGGKFCYVNGDHPTRKIDDIIREQEESGIRIARIKASHCIDMLASEEERNRIAGGRDIYWLTPGWMKYRRFVFQGWDKGLANENFPKHDGGAIMLDAVGYYDTTMEEDPEAILEFSDWMGIPMEPWPVSLNRLVKLLTEVVSRPDRSEKAYDYHDIARSFSA
jgi:hypothetical protein